MFPTDRLCCNSDTFCYCYKNKLAAVHKDLKFFFTI